MMQVARNLLDPVDGFLRNTTHLIHDRDPLFTKAGRISADCSTSTAARPRDLLPWVLGHYGKADAQNAEEVGRYGAG